MNRKGSTQWLFAVTFILSLVLGAAVEMPAQAVTESGALSGVIYKKDKETPLKKVKIRLEAVEKRWGGRTYTSQPANDQGQFTMTGIPAGRYKVLVISRGGRKLKTRTIVNIEAGKTLERDFHVKRKGFLGGCIPCGFSVLLIGLLILL